jgi:U32 family peptidase
MVPVAPPSAIQLEAVAGQPREPHRVGRPEVLAPAGDEDSLHVALAAGADAVYLGLGDGFNARARAQNFALADLRRVVATVHQAGARAYLTLNTLVFEVELPRLAQVLTEVARAGVDALIVQDPGLALLAKQICPQLELHASTQMTISSGEAARFAETLGVTRIVLPRELSVAEIRTLAAATHLELEVFVLGALCVSWSGQCLSSEAWGGRSANRGQCAQACRLPYELIVDDELRPLGDVAYLLSPQDLAGHRAIGALRDIGVHTFKIEGRQKGPGYVYQAVGSMRRWVDAVCSPQGPSAADVRRLAEDIRDLAVTYSRGFGDGFLAGSDHQSLVEGRYPAHRGVCLGRVRQVGRTEVIVTPEAPPDYAGEGAVAAPLPRLGGVVYAASGPGRAPLEVRAGQGVMFDEGLPQSQEQGGPIFGVVQRGRDLVLSFGTPGPDLRRVRVGARVWVTSDPRLTSQVARALKAPSTRAAVSVTVKVEGHAGSPLRARFCVVPPVQATAAADLESPARAELCTVVSSTSMLTPARARGLDDATLRDKLCALGDTDFELSALDCKDLAHGLFVPVSELKTMRRDAVAALQEILAAASSAERSLGWPTSRIIHDNPDPITTLRGTLRARVELARVASESRPAALVPLCRTDEHLDAAIVVGCSEVVLDWMEMVGLSRAVARAREAGLRVGLATVRVQKPGEEGYDRRLRALAPDALLVRHWAGLMHFAQGSPDHRPREVHGDFSLNVTNSLTALHLLGLGLDTITAAHDLDEAQLMAMLAEVPPHRVAVTVHQHIPTFHTEHCVYANQLSRGRDYRTCGRPCESHRIALRDRVGYEHPVVVDVGCRNTVFNAQAQSAASLVPRLVAAGVRLLRLEFVRETREQAVMVLRAYQELLDGRIEPVHLLERVGVHEQFGVTPGTMKVL